MSTLSRNTSSHRLATLVGTRQILFHMNDLALLWGITNTNTLRVTLRRAVREGWLYRVQRGLYSLHPPEEIDPVMLGAASLHCYCVVSTETVLRDAGLILQTVDSVTFVSAVSRRWEVAGRRFVSRQMVDRFLMHPAGIENRQGVPRATKDRAVADMLYFDPWYHFDHPVDWSAVEAMQCAVGYPRTPHRYAYAADQ